jgi:hypothetical protein
MSTDTPDGQDHGPSSSRKLWFRLYARLRRAHARHVGLKSLALMSAPPLIPKASGEAAEDHGAPRPDGGVILPFPIHGEALLVKLAELLRKQVADCGPQTDPLQLTMSRCPLSRLSIDRKAYIEFHPRGCAYRVIIGPDPATRIILETTDFDILADFVLQYIVTRLAEPAIAEPAT